MRTKLASLGSLLYSRLLGPQECTQAAHAHWGQVTTREIPLYVITGRVVFLPITTGSGRCRTLSRYTPRSLIRCFSPRSVLVTFIRSLNARTYTQNCVGSRRRSRCILSAFARHRLRLPRAHTTTLAAIPVSRV